MAYQSHVHRQDHWLDAGNSDRHVQIGRLALPKRRVWLLIAVCAIVAMALTLATIYVTGHQLAAIDYSTANTLPHETHLIFEPACSPYSALSACVRASSATDYQPTL